MNKIVIKMFQASKGEAFIIHCQNKNKVTNVMIDGGFDSTYENDIKDYLIEMKNGGQKIDLMIITHIDEDHINGAIRFLEDNGHNNDKKIIEVDEVWHNTYRHLQFNKGFCVKEKEERNRRILQELREQGRPINCEEEEKEMNAVHGMSLGSLLLKGEYSWNKATEGEAICTENLPRPHRVSEGIEIQLLSPTHETLNSLAKYWYSELISQGFTGKISNEELFDDAMEFLLMHKNDENVENEISLDMSSSIKSWEEIKVNSQKNLGEDPSCRNASSIAFILKCFNKELLFLGDARASVIVQSLETVAPERTRPIHFDLIKVPHHGSKKNNTIELFKWIDASKYLISTNGEQYKHPHPETLVRIVERGDEKKREIIFNYDSEHNRFLELGKSKGSLFESKYNTTVINL